MSTQQIMTDVWQPQPVTNLVERIPVKKGEKLSKINSIDSHQPWEDIRGLGWIFNEEWI